MTSKRNESTAWDVLAACLVVLKSSEFGVQYGLTLLFLSGIRPLPKGEDRHYIGRILRPYEA
jgi:hypothetical protein